MHNSVAHQAPSNADCPDPPGTADPRNQAGSVETPGPPPPPARRKTHFDFAIPAPTRCHRTTSTTNDEIPSLRGSQTLTQMYRRPPVGQSDVHEPQAEEEQPPPPCTAGGTEIPAVPEHLTGVELLDWFAQWSRPQHRACLITDLPPERQAVYRNQFTHLTERPEPRVGSASLGPFGRKGLFKSWFGTTGRDDSVMEESHDAAPVHHPPNPRGGTACGSSSRGTRAMARGRRSGSASSTTTTTARGTMTRAGRAGHQATYHGRPPGARGRGGRGRAKGVFTRLDNTELSTDQVAHNWRQWRQWARGSGQRGQPAARRRGQ